MASMADENPGVPIRTDAEYGAVGIKGLTGEALASAIMTAVTRAKRRVVLSICQVGMLDESELSAIPGAVKLHVDEAGEFAGRTLASVGTQPAEELAPTILDMRQQVRELHAALDNQGRHSINMWAKGQFGHSNPDNIVTTQDLECYLSKLKGKPEFPVCRICGIALSDVEAEASKPPYGQALCAQCFKARQQSEGRLNGR
jgi:hypothetical protein